MKALVVANKAVVLYPPSSNIPDDTCEAAAKTLQVALRAESELRIAVTKQGLYYEDEPLLHGNAAYRAFALELYNRHLADVRFHSGAKAADLMGFLSILKYSPEEVAAAGGFEARLWQLGVTTITVTEAAVSIINADQLLDDTEMPQLSRAEIEDMLADFASGRPRDRMVMARFIGNPNAVSAYLREVFVEQPDERLGLATAFDRYAEFAQFIQAIPAKELRDPMLQSLAEALKQVEPEVRQAMLVDHILPQARTDESLAAVLCEMDFRDIVELLVENMDPESSAREGLARALRNLAVITGTDRDTLAEAAGGALRSAGFADAEIHEVIETAQPSRLDLPGRPSAVPVRRPVDAVLHMLDAAKVEERDGSTDEGLRALQEEARRGVTDGDVIMAFVTLVTIDHREQQFSAMMAMLEDSLDLLVERGELDIAADSADALWSAAENPALTDEQRRRLEAALGRLTKPDDIRTIAHALRIYPTGSDENLAARRLLGSLGPLAVDPLLEQLADEQDMAVRKSMVDLLCAMAPQYLSEIGAHVNDSRWYVVRNVVTILGSTRSSAMLPYLERTLRHHDVRVRRETIRALSGVSDRVAHEMLIHALTDEDAQNVQLAARNLGAAKVASAIPALEQVARGDGRGSREVGPRVEAIEALGRMGARQSLPTLEALAGRRTIIGAGKTRELAAAADAAMKRIRRPEGGE